MEKERHEIKIHYSNGDSSFTSIYGTKEEITRYYVGKKFNIGTESDLMAEVTRIEFIE